MPTYYKAVKLIQVTHDCRIQSTNKNLILSVVCTRQVPQFYFHFVLELQYIPVYRIFFQPLFWQTLLKFFLWFSYIFMLPILKTNKQKYSQQIFLFFLTCLHSTRDIDQSLSKNFHSYYKDTNLCQPNLNNLSFLNKILKKIQQNLLD